MVDPEAGVACECISEVCPERIDAVVWMEVPQCIRPALVHQVGVGFLHLRPKQCVVDPALRFVDVEVGWHDVEIAHERDWDTELQKFGRVGMQPPKPIQLVLKLRPRNGVAVWQVEAAEDNPVDDGLKVAALAVILIAGSPRLVSSGS